MVRCLFPVLNNGGTDRKRARFADVSVTIVVGRRRPSELDDSILQARTQDMDGMPSEYGFLFLLGDPQWGVAAVSRRSVGLSLFYPAFSFGGGFGCLPVFRHLESLAAFEGGRRSLDGLVLPYLLYVLAFGTLVRLLSREPKLNFRSKILVFSRRLLGHELPDPTLATGGRS